jgi:carbon-monoxide dehydrogenase medium subunit
MQTPAPVDYVRATSVANAISLLQEHGEDARILAGGHSLLPMMRLRIARPEVLVDIQGIEELKQIKVEGNELVLGAMVTHAQVLDSPVLWEHYRIFRECEKVIADPVVRNRGTVGGSMCQADPSEDLSALGAALKGTVVIEGPNGRRTVPMRDFHLGPYEVKVEPSEMVVEVRYPIRPGNGSAYEKVERRIGDWAICSSGVYVVIKNGVVEDCGIGLAAVGAEHYCSPEAEAFLTGKPATEENFAQAAQIAADHCAPTADQRGPADYKQHLAKELTLRALRRAAASTQGA